uniref:Uncharacterized protein n=1 Tax=Nelumbo nucifera TaxID=4432 RepID=A0A822YIU7_NELNU|nr:TPA_asm: hypothetical protein HUJ06_010272 [Nelumbo nucifera]
MRCDWFTKLPSSVSHYLKLNWDPLTARIQPCIGTDEGSPFVAFGTTLRLKGDTSHVGTFGLVSQASRRDDRDRETEQKGTCPSKSSCK